MGQEAENKKKLCSAINKAVVDRVTSLWVSNLAQDSDLKSQLKKVSSDEEIFHIITGTSPSEHSIQGRENSDGSWATLCGNGLDPNTPPESGSLAQMVTEFIGTQDELQTIISSQPAESTGKRMYSAIIDQTSGLTADLQFVIDNQDSMANPHFGLSSVSFSIPTNIAPDGLSRNPAAEIIGNAVRTALSQNND